MDRRDFLVALGAAATLPLGCAESEPSDSADAIPTEAATPPPFDISLAQWSLHRTFFGKALDNGYTELFQGLLADPPSALQGERKPIEFAQMARELDIAAIEYVNTFFFDRATDDEFVAELVRRADGEGVRSLLIMCDAEGDLGDANAERRAAAVENHRKWLECAAALGCHSIRVNAASSGSYEEQQKLAAEGLRGVCELADPLGLGVLVENHGGLSSDGQWLAGTLALVDHPRIGSLPDFGNFKVSETETYDRYQGVAELMPTARAVSAKSYAFDGDGNETTIDYPRMLEIVRAGGYDGYVGIEYEGTELEELDGIQATRNLLERLRT